MGARTGGNRLRTLPEKVHATQGKTVRPGVCQPLLHDEYLAAILSAEKGQLEIKQCSFVFNIV